MKKKILYISDFDFRGSGYCNISIPLCNALSEEYDITALGLFYHWEEHDYPFKLIPGGNYNLMELYTKIHNLMSFVDFDIVICALDISHQSRILGKVRENKQDIKYIAFLPIEEGPLCSSWASVLLGCDGVAVMSKLGEQVCKDAGISAQYIPICADTDYWKKQKDADRKTLGISKDTFIVLTVADNQERKGIGKSMEAFAIFQKRHPESVYVLVTKEYNPIGWDLRDYAEELGFLDNLIIIESGIPKEQLREIYSMADVFILPSRAEGLGMPLLEAMSIGIPIIGTKAGAIPEILSSNRGWLVGGFTHRDVWGNSKRLIANEREIADALESVFSDPGRASAVIKRAKRYVKTRTMEKELEAMKEVIENV